MPDEIVDRSCLMGTVEQHVEKLEWLKALGVPQFACDLQRDDKEETLRIYGESVIPALRETVSATA